MAGPICLHSQFLTRNDSAQPSDPPSPAAGVANVTTDADSRSALLIATVQIDPDVGSGYDIAQFYRTGVDDDSVPFGITTAVGAAWKLGSMLINVAQPVILMAVDPDPPEHGAYALCLEEVDDATGPYVRSMTVLTF